MKRILTAFFAFIMKFVKKKETNKEKLVKEVTKILIADKLKEIKPIVKKETTTMRKKWQGIILHHSLSEDGETLNFKAIKKYHEHKGFDDVSYHFVVEEYKEEPVVICGRPLYQEGAHTLKGFNKTHLGVCIVGNFNIDNLEVKTEEKLVDFLAGLCIITEIPASAIKGHKEADTGRTCPGDFFPLENIKEAVATKVKEIKKVPNPSVEHKKRI